MVKLTRKQREIALRETLILDTARRLILERGYQGLTMDRIAEAIEYSKGTIYLHFSCKEEVLVAVATRILEHRLDMFERAAKYEANTRERMLAMGEAVDLFARLYPDNLRLLQIINSEVVTRKVHEERLARMKATEDRILGIVNGIVRDAVALGDLVLDSGTPPEEVTFGLWSLTDGGYSIIFGSMTLSDTGLTDAFSTVIANCVRLGDGYDWKPLSKGWNVAEARERIRNTIFPEEAGRTRTATRP